MTDPQSKEFQAAVRRLPVALAHDDASVETRVRTTGAPPPSERRLRAVVAAPTDVDPYADPPCTD